MRSARTPHDKNIILLRLLKLLIVAIICYFGPSSSIDVRMNFHENSQVYSTLHTIKGYWEFEVEKPDTATAAITLDHKIV